MAEIRDRGSVLATEEGATKLRSAQASKRDYEGKAWTLQEIAMEAGVDAKTVSRFLKRKQRVDEAKARSICQALGVDFNQVVEIDPSEDHPPKQKHEDKWQQVCRAMLDLQKKLSTNEVIASEAMQFDLLNDEIFVSLALVERKEPEQLSQENHPTRSVERFKEKPPIKYETFQEQVLRSGKSDRIAIIGEPGAGKTTLLQHTAFWILDQKLGLPIWISLGNLVKNGSLQRLKDYLMQVWLEDAIPNVTSDVKSDFFKQLNEQQVWLLLDGADEIVAASGTTLHEINCQLRGWLNQSRILLTCRINVWDADINALRDFQTYRTKEFHYPDQVEQFITNGFRKSNPQSGQFLKDELAKPERVRLQQLVQNPLRLMMLCTTWHEQEGLPSTKAELYERFVDEFYRWNKTKWKKSTLNYALFPSTKAKQQKLNKALGRLACRALDEETSPFRLLHNLVVDELGDPDEDGSDFWLALNLGWLQVARTSAKLSEKVYTFFHPTFQEYFAALAIDDYHLFLNHIPENPNHTNAKYRIFEAHWQEVIILWFGREDKRLFHQKEKFTTQLTDFEDISGNYAFYNRRAYLIAARGIGQYESSKMCEIVNQTVKWSFGYFDSTQQQWMKFAYYLQQEAKSALLQTHRQAAVAALASLLPTIQHEFILLDIIEYLWKIDSGNSLVFNTLEKLINPDQNRFVIENAAEFWWSIDPGNEVLLQRVINLDAQDELGYRGFHVKLEEFDKNTAIKFFTELTKSARTQENRFDAAVRLLKINENNRTAISALLEILQAARTDKPASISLAESAAWHLEKFGKSNPIIITALENLIQNNQEELIYGRVAVSLARINPENIIALKTLDNLIQVSQNYWLRWRIAKCLGELFPTHLLAIETLKNLAQTVKVDSVRLSIARDLQKIVSNNSVSTKVYAELIQSARDDITRGVAIVYLAEIDLTETIVLLEELIHSVQDEFALWRIAHELSKLDPENHLVKPVLEELVQTAQNSEIRLHAADCLLDIYSNNELAIQFLIELTKCSQKTNNVAIKATEQLLADASEKAANILIKNLKTINISMVVTSLLNCLSNDVLKSDSEKFIRCHSVIGNCAQNMSYPDFYKAWHNPLPSIGVELSTNDEEAKP